MQKTVMAISVASLVLASCGWREARVNPRNWFGNSESRPVQDVRAEDAEAEPTNALIPRVRRGIFQRPDAVDNSELIASITGLRIEQTPSGAIIYTEGQAARLGAYDTELRPLDDSAAGVLAFEFRVVYPSDPTAPGTEFTRTIREAVSVTEQDLAGIRTIRVVAAGNVRESRRR
ncbi:MAG: hypothetical protein AB8B51_14705 [Sedimentitalea sp.]